MKYCEGVDIRRIFALFTVLAIAFLVLYVRLTESSTTWFNHHMSRDLARSLDWAALKPSSWWGPEYNYSGGRLPGPAFYLLIAFFWKLTGSVVGILIGLHSITILLSLVVSYCVYKDLGARAGSVFFLSFILMPTSVYISRTLWNPALIVPVNLGYLILVRGIIEGQGPSPRLVIFMFLGAVGAQIHFSCLAGWLSSWLLLFWKRPALRKQLSICMAAALIMTVFFFTNQAQPLGRSIFTSYEAFPEISVHRIFSLLKRMGEMTLWLPRNPTAHGVASLTMQALEHTSESDLFFFQLAVFFRGLLAAVVVACLMALSIKRSDNWYLAYASIWILICSVPLFLFRGEIPYRYGLMIYPMQFLILPLGIQGASKRLAAAAVVLTAIVFSSDAVFLLKLYHLMNCSGRVAHLDVASKELPLKHKLHWLRQLRSAPGGRDPYQHLHGGIASRIRQGEYDWDGFYGGLLRTLPDNKEGKRILVDGGRAIEISLADLPRVTALSYQIGQRVLKKISSVGEAILPFENAPPVHELSLHLAADFSSSDNSFYRLCHDNPLEGDRLHLERALVTPLPEGHRVDAVFNLRRSSQAFPRIEIFKTRDPLPTEDGYYGFKCISLKATETYGKS